MNPIHHGPTTNTMTLRALQRHPERLAFTGAGGPSLSYRATHALIGRLQAALRAQGLQHGQRLALLSANRAESWCLGVAAQCAGLSISWLHPMGSLADQVSQLTDGKCQALAVDVPHFARRGGELAAATAASGVRAFSLGPGDFGPDLLALAQAQGEASPLDMAQATDVATLNYTGGTTGRSKGALRLHAQNAASVLAIAAGFEFPVCPQYLCVAPISHVAGTKIVPTLMLGGTVHLMKGFDPEALLHTLQRERINMTLLVPTMIYLLLDHPALACTDLSALELLLYGASPMAPARLEEGIERMGPVFSQLYGQTECYPISVLRRADHDPRSPELFASCGTPLPSVNLALLDDADQPVPDGEPGEICVRAPHATLQYWQQPELTQELFRGGWLHTGDIARRCERGYLTIMDRKKDMIVSGGFNIYPREVEDALASHPDVAMSAVVGTPDAKWGEAVVAMVVPRPGTRPDALALMAHVKARKGAAHSPKRVEFVAALPMTPVGKVDKKALRAQFWAGQARQVG